MLFFNNRDSRLRWTRNQHWNLVPFNLYPPKRLHDDGTGPAETFIEQMDKIPVSQRGQAMDAVVKGTPARWWATHEQDWKDWAQVVECIRVRFQPSQDIELLNRYKGVEDPQKEHIWYCERRWTEKKVPKEQWAHRFVHTVDVVPRSWYIQEEWRRQTRNW